MFVPVTWPGGTGTSLGHEGGSRVPAGAAPPPPPWRSGGVASATGAAVASAATASSAAVASLAWRSGSIPGPSVKFVVVIVDDRAGAPNWPPDPVGTAVLMPCGSPGARGLRADAVALAVGDEGHVPQVIRDREVTGPDVLREDELERRGGVLPRHQAVGSDAPGVRRLAQ